jgi:hypothetical protein
VEAVALEAAVVEAVAAVLAVVVAAPNLKVLIQVQHVPPPAATARTTTGPADPPVRSAISTGAFYGYDKYWEDNSPAIPGILESIHNYFTEGITDSLTNAWTNTVTGVHDIYGIPRPGSAYISADVRPGIHSFASASVTVAEQAALLALTGGVGEAVEAAEIGGGTVVSSVPRTFTSTDPLVADLANEIEAAYPGHVISVNTPLQSALGSTDADILLQNSVIQVKSGGSAQGLLLQLQKSEAATGLPSIGFGPNLPAGSLQALTGQGGLVTKDRKFLLQLIKP